MKVLGTGHNLGHWSQSWALVSSGHLSQSGALVTVLGTRGRPGLHVLILRCHRSMSICYCFMAILFLSVDRFLLMFCGNQSAPLCMAHPVPEAHCPASLIPLLLFFPLLPLAFSCPPLFSFLARVYVPQRWGLVYLQTTKVYKTCLLSLILSKIDIFIFCCIQELGLYHFCFLIVNSKVKTIKIHYFQLYI